VRDSKAPIVHNVEYWQCLLVARDNEAQVVYENGAVVALFIHRRPGYIKTVKNGR
jgi:hypothetical protein